MFIKYTDQENKIKSIYNSDDIESITSNKDRTEIYIKYKNSENINPIFLNNPEELDKVLNQFAELLSAESITSQITETENLDTIL